MSSRSLRTVTSALALLAVLGCDRKTDYDYFNNPDKPVSFEHKVKELNGNANLDILWVIDNSASMSAHQNDVIANMNSFIQGLVASKNLKWKMGLVSTTTTDQPYIGFAPGDELDYTSVNAVSRFNNAVSRLGLDGDVFEKMYDPIVESLTNFPNFLRPKSFLAIIIVSDAPEQSTRSTQDFINDITRIKGSLSDVLVYDFANPVDWCVPTDDPFNWQGSKIQQLLTQVKGAAYKLCDPNFGQQVADLGALVAQQVTTPRIDLADRPIVSTIKVFHKNQEIPGGPPPTGYWQYDVRMNAILFTDMSIFPDPNESVRVTYSVYEN